MNIPKITAAFIINSTLSGLCKKLTYKGTLVEEGTNLKFRHLQLDEDGRAYVPKSCYNKIFASFNESTKKAFKNTLQQKHFAIAIGEKDSWEFKWGWKRFCQESENYKNLKVKFYPRAGHLVSAPYTPFATTVYNKLWADPSFNEGILMKYGGELIETVEMKEDTWRWMFEFINTYIR